MVAGEKVRNWTLWVLMIAIAVRFYLVQELLAAYAIFAIGFAALTVVALSLCLLYQGWEFAAVRITDSLRRMEHSTRAANLLAVEDRVRLKSAQKLKTENRNSKD